MKKILICAIIFISISLHANGQQSQDTLYLKNGYKAVGKFLGESEKECRFRTTEGIYFTFSPGEVDRIVVAPKMILRQVNPDALNIDQLNLYIDKAVKMRNQGRTLTLTGLGVMATGTVTGLIMLNNAKPHGPPEDPHGSMLGFFVIGFAGMVGIPCTLVGVPIWAVGGSRKAKAEISLQKFNLMPENSKALGLGITISF